MVHLPRAANFRGRQTSSGGNLPLNAKVPECARAARRVHILYRELKPLAAWHPTAPGAFTLRKRESVQLKTC